jgi:hypothetical protein
MKRINTEVQAPHHQVALYLYFKSQYPNWENISLWLFNFDTVYMHAQYVIKIVKQTP